MNRFDTFLNYVVWFGVLSGERKIDQGMLWTMREHRIRKKKKNIRNFALRQLMVMINKTKTIHLTKTINNIFSKFGENY